MSNTVSHVSASATCSVLYKSSASVGASELTFERDSWPTKSQQLSMLWASDAGRPHGKKAAHNGEATNRIMYSTTHAFIHYSP